MGSGIACSTGLLGGLIMALATTAAESAVEAGAEVRVLVDVPYVAEPGHPDAKDRLDLYVPAASGAGMSAGTAEGGRPGVLWVHGGGLFMGDKSVATNVGLALARAGFVTAAVNHRLSPEVSHPAHAEDVARAFAWLVENARRIGLDPERIALAGHSAGGYLVGLSCTDARYLRAVGHDLEDVAACVPMSGFFHVARLAPERPKHVWGEDEAVWQDASPASHAHDGVPPLLALWADGDTEARKATNRDFVEVLRAAGAGRVETREIGDRTHRSIATLIGTPDDPATTAMVEFLRAHTRSVLDGS